MNADLLKAVQQACTSLDTACTSMNKLKSLLEKKPAPAAMDEDSSSESDAAPAPKAKAAKPTPKAAPKKQDSDSDSDSDSDAKPAKPAAKPKPAAKKVESDSDSDSDSDVPAAKPKPKPKPAAKKDDSDSDSDSDSDAPAAKPKPKPKPKAAAADSDSDSSDSDAKPVAKPAPKKAEPEKRKQPETWSAPESKAQKTEDEQPTEMLVMDIPDSMTDDDIWNHYKAVGDDISRMNRPATRPNMCFVSFTSGEALQKAIKMDAPEGTWTKVNEPRGKGKGKGGGGGFGSTFDVMIRGCADTITDEVVYEHFKSLGKDAIAGVNWVKDRDDGHFKGFGFIKFSTKEIADKAVEMGGPLHDEYQTTLQHANKEGGKGGDGKGKGKGGKGDKGGKGKGKGKGKGGPSMVPEGTKVAFDD